MFGWVGGVAAQKSVVEKVLPQLEKSTISKLEATMTKQLTTQFQTTGRQALQVSWQALSN
jgi:enhancer of mRNA-decapping protein 4